MLTGLECYFPKLPKRGIVDMEHKVKGEGATGEAAMLAAYCKLYTEAEKIITNSPTEHS